MLFMPYDKESQSRNVLASPLGEAGHEVAKGCTRVRMIMILDVDVTAERRHYNTHRPAGDTATLGLKGRQTYEPSGPWGRSILRTLPHNIDLKKCGAAATTTLSPLGLSPLERQRTQPAAIRRPQPSGRSPVNPHTVGVSKGISTNP